MDTFDLKWPQSDATFYTDGWRCRIVWRERRGGLGGTIDNNDQCKRRVADSLMGAPYLLNALRARGHGPLAEEISKLIHEIEDDTQNVADEMRQEDQLVGAVLAAGDIRFLLAQDDFENGRDRDKGVGFRLYCTTAQEIDAVARDIEARGGVLDQPPTDQPWGARDFAVVDPDGFKISISTGLSEE